MGVNSGILPFYLLTVLICVESQFYGPYQQYGYTPYNQYNPGQNLVYNPYPSYVSNQFTPYIPQYGYPLPYVSPNQNNPVQNKSVATYVQNYPVQQSYSQVYPQYVQPYVSSNLNNPVQQSYPQVYPQYIQPVYTPYPYTIKNITSNSTWDSTYGNGNSSNANITTEIIDVEPAYFNYYRRLFNLPAPIIIQEDSAASGVRKQFRTSPYVVKTQSKSYNFTNIPHSFTKSDVQTKTYTFKRTFTLDPSKKENAVVKLNFVNGVEVTTEQPNSDHLSDKETTSPVVTYPSAILEPYVTDSPTTTTTESEEPANILSWI